MPGPWTFCLCKTSRNTNGAQRAWMPDRVESTEHVMWAVVTGYACAAPRSSLQLRLCLQCQQQTHGPRMPVSLSTVHVADVSLTTAGETSEPKGRGGKSHDKSSWPGGMCVQGPGHPGHTRQHPSQREKILPRVPTFS